MNYLVAYVSKTGTTEEIGVRIAKILEERGNRAETKPICDSLELSGYDRIILGSPVNGMKVLPEFDAFCKGKALACSAPKNLFIVSYLFENGRPMWRKAIQKEKSRLAGLLGARSAEIFGGRLEKELPVFARFMFGTPKDMPLDIRNWEAIDSWAKSL
ncbi:MAG: flavodoxin domain-containing protein [Spirochaetia bacterium]|jgi:menaquinone-dependent protoporphyrinogen IX oxidase|nr:flavodoxin domain-containing protein [Spirochaetales bacterium]MDX9784372.1 flavodoxin domain-containing protein [Spirochaetia bacterium]